MLFGHELGGFPRGDEGSAQVDAEKPTLSAREAFATITRKTALEMYTGRRPPGGVICKPKSMIHQLV